MNLSPRIIETLQTGKGDKILLVPKSPLLLRMGGTVVPSGLPPVTPQDVRETLSGLATIANYQIVASAGKTTHGTFTLSTQDVGRLRVNFIIQRGTPVVFIERLSSHIPALLECIPNPELQDRIAHLIENETGIILFTGSKASEVAEVIYAILKHINDTKNQIIYTVEKPIQYILNNNESVVIQREVGVDVESMALGISQGSFLEADILYVSDAPDRESVVKLIEAANRATLCLLRFPAWSPSLAIKLLRHLYGDEDLFSQVVRELLPAVVQIVQKKEIVLYTGQEKEALLHGA